MEKFFQNIPKPVLALSVIAIGIVVILIAQPPHSLCDTERESFQKSLVGSLYAEKIDKKKGSRPGRIREAKNQCKLGSSSGACFEYFSILRQLAKGLKSQSSECFAEVIEAPGVKSSMKEGFLLMIRLAWGDQLPNETTPVQGWFAGTDVAAFCQVREVLKSSLPEEEWSELVQESLGILPGPRETKDLEAQTEASPPSPALRTLSEEAVFRKSLLSLRCESFL